jgi:hypothetical protein
MDQRARFPRDHASHVEIAALAGGSVFALDLVHTRFQFALATKPSLESGHSVSRTREA